MQGGVPPPEMATAAVDTHPTGMHSCPLILFIRILEDMTEHSISLCKSA